MDTADIIETYFPLVPADIFLFPEIKLHWPKFCEFDTLRDMRSTGEIPATWKEDPTFYGRSYLGGTYLARYILEHPEEVRGKNMVDIGSGSGIVAIAEKMAGAAHVTAVDNDPIAVEFIRRNRTANNVDFEIIQKDALETSFDDTDIISAADIFGHSPKIEEMLLAEFRRGKSIFACRGNHALNLLVKHGTPLSPSERLSLGGCSKPACLLKLAAPIHK